MAISQTSNLLAVAPRRVAQGRTAVAPIVPAVRVQEAVRAQEAVQVQEAVRVQEAPRIRREARQRLAELVPQQVLVGRTAE